MRKRRLMMAAFVVLAIFAGSLWLLVRPSDPIIQGKRQSEWIKSLSRTNFQSGYDQYQWEQEQVKQWRALGPQGVQMLCRALEDGSGSFAQSYLRFYKGLDERIQHCLPKPRDTSHVRSSAAFMLGSLAKENRDVAIPALLKAFKRDPDSDVRLDISAFLAPELFKGRDKDRLAFLPELIKAAKDPHSWAVRGNAFYDMRMYPDQAATLIPVLTNALSDPGIDARWHALETLHAIAPDAAKPQIVAAITNMFRDPEEQVFLPGRIEWLGEMRKDALSAAPALVDEMYNTNAAIAQAARHALMKIAPEIMETNGGK